MRVLYYGDGPSTNTGLGLVARQILLGLHGRGHEVRSVAFNYDGCPHGLPFEVA